MTILALKQVEINTKRCIKNQFENPLQILSKIVHGNPNLQAPKICQLEANSAALTADGRPPTVRFPTVAKVGRLAGRPTFPTVENPTVGGRPLAVRTAELASNGQIFGAYKMGLPQTVLDKILSGFSSQFLIHLLVFISTCLRAKIVISKESFQECFVKEIS